MNFIFHLIFKVRNIIVMWLFDIFKVDYLMKLMKLLWEQRSYHLVKL